LPKYLTKFWVQRTSAEIEDRFEEISERFLHIWKFPSIEIPEDIDFDEVNIFDAEEPIGKKLEYAIFFDQKLEYN